MARAVRAGAMSVLHKASALADGSTATARPQQACAQHSTDSTAGLRQAASTAEQLGERLAARGQQELAAKRQLGLEEL